MRNTLLITFDARRYLRESENFSIWETSGENWEPETFHYAVLFYSISLVLEAKRLASVRFTAKFKDKYFTMISGSEYWKS